MYVAVRHRVDVLDEPGMMARRKANDLPWFYAEGDLRPGWLELICPNCGEHSRRRFDEFFVSVNAQRSTSNPIKHKCKFCKHNGPGGNFPFGTGPDDGRYWTYRYHHASASSTGS